MSNKHLPYHTIPLYYLLSIIAISDSITYLSKIYNEYNKVTYIFVNGIL